jgi:8-oxo-dGTP pyrophosphatase MutT (NUDIX family)
MRNKEHTPISLGEATLPTSHISPSRSDLSGQWDHNTSWRFELGEQPPSISVCASVGAVVMSAAGLSLTRTPRDYWELPGGHIEPRETAEQALHREVLEEVALSVKTSMYFGSTIVTARNPIINKAKGLPYPNPGYIPHYLCWGELASGMVGEEVVEIKHVRLDSLSILDQLEIPERGILEIGLARSLILPELTPSDRDLITQYLSHKGLQLDLFRSIWSHDEFVTRRSGA